MAIVIDTGGVYILRGIAAPINEEDASSMGYVTMVDGAIRTAFAAVDTAIRMEFADADTAVRAEKQNIIRAFDVTMGYVAGDLVFDTDGFIFYSIGDNAASTDVPTDDGTNWMQVGGASLVDINTSITNLNTEVWGSDTQTGNSRIDNIDTRVTTLEDEELPENLVTVEYYSRHTGVIVERPGPDSGITQPDGYESGVDTFTTTVMDNYRVFNTVSIDSFMSSFATITIEFVVTDSTGTEVGSHQLRVNSNQVVRTNSLLLTDLPAGTYTITAMTEVTIPETLVDTFTLTSEVHSDTVAGVLVDPLVEEHFDLEYADIDLETSVGTTADARDPDGTVYARIAENVADITTIDTSVTALNTEVWGSDTQMGDSRIDVLEVAGVGGAVHLGDLVDVTADVESITASMDPVDVRDSNIIPRSDGDTPYALELESENYYGQVTNTLSVVVDAQSDFTAFNTLLVGSKVHVPAGDEDNPADANHDYFTLTELPLAISGIGTDVDFGDAVLPPSGPFTVNVPEAFQPLTSITDFSMVVGAVTETLDQVQVVINDAGTILTITFNNETGANQDVTDITVSFTFTDTYLLEGIPTQSQQDAIRAVSGIVTFRDTVGTSFDAIHFRFDNLTAAQLGPNSILALEDGLEYILPTGHFWGAQSIPGEMTSVFPRSEFDAEVTARTGVDAALRTDITEIEESLEWTEDADETQRIGDPTVGGLNIRGTSSTDLIHSVSTVDFGTLVLAMGEEYTLSLSSPDDTNIGGFAGEVVRNLNTDDLDATGIAAAFAVNINDGVERHTGLQLSVANATSDGTVLSVHWLSQGARRDPFIDELDQNGITVTGVTFAFIQAGAAFADLPDFFLSEQGVYYLGGQPIGHVSITDPNAIDGIIAAYNTANGIPIADANPSVPDFPEGVTLPGATDNAIQYNLQIDDNGDISWTTGLSDGQQALAFNVGPNTTHRVRTTYIPNAPTTPTADTQYNLQVDDAGDTTWVEDTGGGTLDTLTGNIGLDNLPTHTAAQEGLIFKATATADEWVLADDEIGVPFGTELPTSGDVGELFSLTEDDSGIVGADNIIAAAGLYRRIADTGIITDWEVAGFSPDVIERQIGIVDNIGNTAIVVGPSDISIPIVATVAILDQLSAGILFSSDSTMVTLLATFEFDGDITPTELEATTINLTLFDVQGGAEFIVIPRRISLQDGQTRRFSAVYDITVVQGAQYHTRFWHDQAGVTGPIEMVASTFVRNAGGNVEISPRTQIFFDQRYAQAGTTGAEDFSDLGGDIALTQLPVHDGATAGLLLQTTDSVDTWELAAPPDAGAQAFTDLDGDIALTQLPTHDGTTAGLVMRTTGVEDTWELATGTVRTDAEINDLADARIGAAILSDLSGVPAIPNNATSQQLVATLGTLTWEDATSGAASTFNITSSTVSDSFSDRVTTPGVIYQGRLRVVQTDTTSFETRVLRGDIATGIVTIFSDFNTVRITAEDAFDAIEADPTSVTYT